MRGGNSVIQNWSVSWWNRPFKDWKERKKMWPGAELSRMRWWPRRRAWNCQKVQAFHERWPRRSTAYRRRRTVRSFGRREEIPISRGNEFSFGVLPTTRDELQHAKPTQCSTERWRGDSQKSHDINPGSFIIYLRAHKYMCVFCNLGCFLCLCPCSSQYRMIGRLKKLLNVSKVCQVFLCVWIAI